VAAEYTKELVEGKMTEDQVLQDINHTSPIIVKYITKAYHSILAENGQLKEFLASERRLVCFLKSMTFR
jgi:hypothetical protein